MKIKDIKDHLENYYALKQKVRAAGIAKIQALHPNSAFIRYLYLYSMDVEEGKLVATFDFHEDAPYRGAEQVIFTAEEVAAL